MYPSLTMLAPFTLFHLQFLLFAMWFQFLIFQPFFSIFWFYSSSRFSVIAVLILNHWNKEILISLNLFLKYNYRFQFPSWILIIMYSQYLCRITSILFTSFATSYLTHPWFLQLLSVFMRSRFLTILICYLLFLVPTRILQLVSPDIQPQDSVIL